MNTSLKNICNSSKLRFDLTSESDQDYLFDLVDKIKEFPITDIIELGNNKNTPLSFRIAAKIADSKKYISSTTQKLKVAVVFAMWGEQNRLKKKSDDNPNGEDSLNVKINQLDWLFRDSSMSWRLYAVDDGCPYGSGSIAESIMQNSESKNKVDVLFLENALPSFKQPLKHLKSANDSKKGGAILLGCDKSLQDDADVIIYTDADNSVHLSQIGLLLRPYLETNNKVVLGNRKDDNAVLVKQENR